MSVEGKKLSTFSLEGSGGKTWNFPANFANKLTLIYFYPKDNTPGCTRQACAYRDMSTQFQNAGIQVLGVSKDSVSSHENFIENYQLTFALLSDPDKALAQELEVTGRDSFLINDSGVVVAEWKNVKPDTTAQITFDTAQKYLQTLAQNPS